jgi:hypothetical protein
LQRGDKNTLQRACKNSIHPITKTEAAPVVKNLTRDSGPVAAGLAMQQTL